VLLFQLPHNTAQVSLTGKGSGGCGEVKLGEEKMKYAIVEDGGKQYRAVEGGTIDVDLFNAEAGTQIDLEHVLLVADGDAIMIGTPHVKGAKVQATVASMEKGPKIIVFKYRPKKHYRVKTGHRQHYTRLKIDSIVME
jgi:large subunit ribosomal protein L21